MNRIILILISTLFITSCGEWLDLQPENDQVTDNFWQNKEEVEAVLGAGYVTLRDMDERLIDLGEARGGSLSILGGLLDLFNLNRWNITPQNSLVKWDQFYQIINYANSVIQYGPDVVEKDDSFDESVMQSYLSEAYFLRGLCYFYLARNWRDVPLITTAYVNDDQVYEIPKSSEAAVFEQVIADFERALPASKEIFPEVWQTKGRATKWAIKAALADAYLWVGRYEDAIFQLNEIISSGRVGLINGTGPTGDNLWFRIFSEGNTNESIFELQYDFDLGQTNDLRTTFGGNSVGLGYLIGENLFLQFQEEPDDIRGAGATFVSASNGSIWKYLGQETGGVVPRENGDQNLIIYRMADVYLMKAEALAMMDNLDEAMNNVNLVRQRAGITTPLPTPSTQVLTLQNILDERAKEFVGEAKRWYDLLRIGKRNDFEYKELLIQEVLKGAPSGSSSLIQSKLFDTDAYYLPIHIDELRANRNLVQNPYYETLN